VRFIGVEAVVLTLCATTAATAQTADADVKEASNAPEIVASQAAIATVFNHAPSGWQAVMRGAGAIFNYDGGGSDLVQKNEINLGSGASTDIPAPESECVTTMRVAAAVQARDESPKVFFQDTHARQGECLIHVNFELAPKQSASRSGKRSLSDLLELRLSQ
jgi:hypothetical protein